jgi:GNAT superfamily N-acetyltransferase
VTEADDAQERLTAEDLGDELAPWVDLDRDTALGVDAGGVARAFGTVQIRPGDTTDLRAFCWGGVHPQWRGRGIGRSLLGWQLERARALVAARRAELGTAVSGGALLNLEEHLHPAARLAERAGMHRARWMSIMRRDLSLPVPELATPPGLRLVPYSAELDEPLRLAHNEAFTEHWGFQPHDRQTWQTWSTGHRNFAPQWSFALLDGDEIAAYALSAAYEQDWPAQGYTEGWTSKLGVRAPWRRQGLAKVLLAASLEAFRRDGMQYGGLDVDSENPTGAVSLYTGMGYEVLRRSVAWRLEL